MLANMLASQRYHTLSKQAAPADTADGFGALRLSTQADVVAEILPLTLCGSRIGRIPE